MRTNQMAALSCTSWVFPRMHLLGDHVGPRLLDHSKLRTYEVLHGPVLSRFL